MAVAFSTHALPNLRPSSNFAPFKPSISNPLSLLRFQYSTRNPMLRLSITSPTGSRSSFTAAVKVADTHSKRIEGEEDGEISEEESENEAVNEEPQPVITLFHAYKEAIVEGDLHKISDIETKLYAIETEKNALEQQITSLSAELSSGKEKFLWLKADFENFRKRSEKDRLTLTSDVQGDVIESLLPMVDNFERAKQQLKPETEKEKKIDGSYQGIYKQFVEIMRSLKVAVVETVGKPFDPSLHEAIAREESVEYKEGIIIQEFRRGFVLGDRLLRPAMVKVSAGPGPRKPSPGSPKPKPTEQLGGVQDSSVSPQPSEVGNI